VFIAGTFSSLRNNTSTNTTTVNQRFLASYNYVAPTPVINPPACAGLVCNLSGVGSADPNTADTFTTCGPSVTAPRPAPPRPSRTPSRRPGPGR